MNLASNNNKNIITHLAKRSVKSNKMRNFFTVFAIALSVSLLTVMGVYISGREVAERRQVGKMQHVIYEAIAEDRALAMADEDEVSVLFRMKSGVGIELGSKIVQPTYYDETPVKGKAGEISVNEMEEGNYPQKIREAAVTRAYCELVGADPKIGSTIVVTAIDGTTEEFEICGLLKGDWENVSIYPLILSKEYADNGAMLSGVPYKAIVKLKGAENMQQSAFEERIVELGEAYGVKRRDVNANNSFKGTLAGNARQAQERIVLGAICVGILFVSILVIYSVFYLSVIGRIRQFGQLRTLGMTKKQIRRMITREGLILSGIGIPIGLLIGGSIGYLLQRTGWDWFRTLVIAGAIIVADVITVWLSIYKPAMLAAETSPIEAAKFTGELKEKKKKKAKDRNKGVREAKKLQRSMTPLGLAKISAGRNRKKTFLTVLSLGIGGILFMLAATFITATNLDEYSRQSGFAWGEYVIYLSNNAAEINEHGQSGIQKNNPLDEELKEQLLSIDGVQKVHQFKEMEMNWEARGEAEKDSVHPFDEKEFQTIQEKYIDRDSGLHDVTYDEMTENQQILIMGNNVVKEIWGWEFEVGDEVKMRFDNGDEIIEKEYTVAGMVDDWRYNDVAPGIGWFCMPQSLVDEVAGDLNLNEQYVVETDESKAQAIESQISDVLKDKPELVLNTLRERKLEDEKSFTLLYTIILGLSIFIIGFSMLNLINTLITNIITRKQEFAMLQSVGMSQKQLNRMVRMEGLLLSAGNAVITLIFGTALGYAGVQMMRAFAARYMHYKFPVWFYLGYIVVLIVVPVLVTGVVLRGFQKQGLTERLRIQD